MKRLLFGVALFIVFLFAGYSYFHGASVTSMIVVDQPPQTTPQAIDVAVREEHVDKAPPVVENVSENTLLSNSVWVYNVKDGGVVDIIPVGQSPLAVQVSPKGWWLYVLNGFSRSISVVDTETFAIVKTIAVGDEPRTMRLSPNGEFLAVVTYTNKIIVFDTKDFSQVATVSVGKKSADVVFSLVGKYLLSVSERNNLLEKVNPYLGHAIGSATVGTGPVSVALSTKNHAFVVNAGSDGVSIIDVADMSRAKKYDVKVGVKPVAVILDQNEANVFVANKGSDSVTVLDAGSYKVLADIVVGHAPVALVYDWFTQPNALVYVANEGSNDVSVVDTKTNKELNRWKAGEHPSSLALSPDGKLLFVAMKGKRE